jgi:hypothetical protein
MPVERRIWLTMSELASDGGVGPKYVVRPAPKEQAAAFEAVYWIPKADSSGVTIVWTSGFNGVSMSLHWAGQDHGTLTGEATSFSDALGAPPSHADVSARRDVCGPAS